MSISKRKKVSDKQLSFFDLLTKQEEEKIKNSPLFPGSLNIQTQLKETISQALKQCPLSRWEVAGKMSALLGIEVSRYTLDAWTAESKEYHRFPAEYLPAFCRVVGSMEPLSFLARQAGGFLLPGPEALRAEIQRLDEDIQKKKREKQKRVVFLREAEGEG